MKTATPTVPKSEEIDAVWNTKIKIDLILSQEKAARSCFFTLCQQNQ